MSTPVAIKPRVESPAFVPVTDFLAQCGTEVEYLLDPYIPKGGFVLVMAAPKAGKTFFVSWLAASVAAKGKPVLLVEEEGPREVLRDRVLPFLDPNAAAYRDTLHIAHRKGFRLDNERSVDNLIKWALSTKAELIILDPFVQLHSQDENEQSAMGAVLQAITRIIAETGCAVVLVHHTRKGASWNKSDDSEAQSSDARGSGALVGAADSVISIKSVLREDRQPGEVRFWIENTDTRVGAPFDKLLAIVRMTGGRDAMSFQAPESRVDAEIKRLLPYIPFEPEVITVDDLLKEAGGSTEKVRSAIRSAVGDGIVRRRLGKKGGIYRVRNDRPVGDRRSPSDPITDDRHDSIGESAEGRP